MCVLWLFVCFRHRYYIEKYNLEGQVLPHTAILDPRTGAPLLKVNRVGVCDPTAARRFTLVLHVKVKRQLVHGPHSNSNPKPRLSGSWSLRTSAWPWWSSWRTTASIRQETSRKKQSLFVRNKSKIKQKADCVCVCTYFTCNLHVRCVCLVSRKWVF